MDGWMDGWKDGWVGGLMDGDDSLLLTINCACSISYNNPTYRERVGIKSKDNETTIT